MSRMGEIAGEVFLVAECQGDGMGEALCKHFHTFCVLAPIKMRHPYQFQSINLEESIRKKKKKKRSSNTLLQIWLKFNK